MTGREHRYEIAVEWTGNTGTGTSAYRAYERRHEITAPGTGKPPLPGSSDPAFRGDPARWNPEELLVAALSACHQLWYLHLCATAGVVVVGYVDRAEGIMAEDPAGGGRFLRAVLRPVVTVSTGSDLALAHALHERAHAQCFIASSVNFPVTHEAEVREAGALVPGAPAAGAPVAATATAGG
jgi:organic hydroperoxide reductase OsmC/OhrA